MTVTPGQTLSHYQLLAPIGEGGMGVVWRATDTTLGREVAIKLLPPEFSADAERLARFEREARLLASLNHPNIASIYGLDSDAGQRFLVMEVVEGETLGSRLSRGALPLEEALALARQIAEALEAAHEKGIVHRDLKPANVMLTPAGQAKLLDFGLARAFEGETSARSSSDLSRSPTITAMTQAHVILGTAAYMSPEQARGQVVDKRADVWAFGVVLFEMLTGRQLFEGDTVSDTLAAVLKTEPDWSALPRATPARVRALLARCLERSPRARLRDIGEARIALDPAATALAAGPPPVAETGGRRPPRALALAAAALLAGIAGTLVLTRIVARPPAGAPLRHVLIAPSADASRFPAGPAISPDGRSVAFLTTGKVWVQDLSDNEPRLVVADPQAKGLFWSPDSRTLGYLSGGRVMKVAAAGGEPQTVCDARGPFTGGSGATWTEAGTIVCSRAEKDGMLETPALGGDAHTVLPLDSTREGDVHEPAALPGGRGVLFVSHQLSGGPDNISLWAGGRRRQPLRLEGQVLRTPVYSATGHILFQRGPTNAGIWALPFSLSRLAVTGPAFLVVPGGTSPSVSREGTLACIEGGTGVPVQMVWVDRSGKELGTIGAPHADVLLTPALSRDGGRVALAMVENDNADIWIYDVARDTRTRLTLEPGYDGYPSWTPDGSRIVYVSRPHGSGEVRSFSILSRAADGTGLSDTLATGGAVMPAVSPDGRALVYARFTQAIDLEAITLEGRRSPLMQVRSGSANTAPRISPDGRYLAYGSDESGRQEIYLKRFPSGDGRWQVSTGGGAWPHWGAKGDRLYYVDGDDLYEVAVTLGEAPVLGTPRKLFSRPPLGSPGFGLPASFDVAGDGDRFLILRGAEQNARVQGVTLVQNWFSAFQERR